MNTDIRHLKNEFYHDANNNDIIIHKDGIESYKKSKKLESNNPIN